MKIIVAANNKGGVGKTKISSLITEYACKILNKRVLGIDLDSQCNYSQRYLSMEADPAAPDGWMPPPHPDFEIHELSLQGWDGRSSIAGIFHEEGVTPYPTHIPNFDIAPAYAHKLINAEAVRKSEVIERVHDKLHEFLCLPDVQAAYDLVVIDTPPAKGPLTISAIKAATHMVIPCVMEELPIQGVFGMLQLWMQESLIRGERSKLELIGILTNKFNNTNLHKDMYDSLVKNDKLRKHMMEYRLGDRIIFAEKDCHNTMPKSIFDLPDSNQAKLEAMAVCKEITRKVFQ